MSTPKGVKVKTSDGWQDLAIVGPQGPPSGQMVLIEEKYLPAGGTPSMDFQNIPQIFSHLVLMGDCEQVGGATGIRLRFNNDSGNSYYYAEQYNTGNTPAASAVGVQSGLRIAVAMGVATSNGCSVVVEVPNYRNPLNKQCISRCAFWENTNMAGRWYAGTWRSTAAINRITVYTENGSNFAAGTRLSLYGIKAEPEGVRQNWSDIFAQTIQGHRPNISIPFNAWTLLPIPDVPNLIITKADGTNPDFTRNADGTLTINKTGNYHFDASVTSADPLSDGSDVNVALCKKAGAIPVIGDLFSMSNVMVGGATNPFIGAPVTADRWCEVGDRIAILVYHYSGGASAKLMQLHSFNVHRTGAGPPGPQGAGALLNAQSAIGTEEAYSSNFTGGAAFIQVWRNLAGTLPLRLIYTPPVDCWWDVNFNMGVVNKVDAAYHYLYGGIRITPADVDGVTMGLHLITQHTSVQTYDHRVVRRMFKLAAGTQYTIDGILGNGNGGTWNYYLGINHLWLDGRAFSR